MLIHLRIDPHDSGWAVSLRERDTRGVRGTTPAAAVDAVRAARGQLGGGAVVLLPGLDSRQTAAEEALGRALTSAITADPLLAREWARLLGVAEGRQEPITVAIDAEAYAIRSLPWELLAHDPLGAPLEAAGGVVLRLAKGRAGGPLAARGPIQTLAWTPQPDDPAVSHIAAHIQGVCAQHALPPPLPVPVPVDAQAGGGPAVLHLVCHGETLSDQLRLLGSSELSSGTAVHMLSPLLPRAALVVLSVCEGGADLPRELDGLSERLLAAGARAVVSASGALSVDAAERFLEGLYDALAEGAVLSAAVAAGRRAVRGLAAPYPDSRWHRLRLLVGDLQAAEQPLRQAAAAGWTPPGWPRPAPDAAEQLACARRVAEAMGGGFVGVEHLALALVEQPPVAGLEAVRYPLGLRLTEIRDGLAQFIPTPGRRDAALRLSPRLVALGAHLPAGFSTVQLWQALLAHAGAVVQQLSGSDAVAAMAAGDVATVQTWDPSGARYSAVPEALEILGGPEDGRRLRPKDGQSIGRWAEPARSDLLLYAETLLTDPRLSRRHLVWDAAGQVTLVSPGRQLSQLGHTERKPRGAQHLSVGDQLWLSRATCLLAVLD